jgi:hypothetical protein
MRNILLVLLGVVLGAGISSGVDHLLGTPVRADSSFAMTSASAKFVVRSAVVGNVFFTVRIDTTTGDSWYASAGKWVKYADTAAPGAGTYDIQLLPMADGKSYNLVRSDIASGRAWYIAGTNWSPIADQ